MSKGEVKRLSTEVALDVATTHVVDTLKEQGLSVFSEILADTITSALPGIGGAIVGYKTSKLKRNVEEIERILVQRIDEIQQIFHSKTIHQQEEIDKLFEHMLNSTLEEPQKEKIDFFLNGFINISRCEEINEDFVLIFYDTLRELRLVDLTVLKLYGRYFLNEQETNVNSYDDVIKKHNITYEQYDLVRQNLVKKGILTTETDIVLEKDLKALEEAIKELKNYVELITNPKKDKYPRLKTIKLKYNDRFKITKFGREFIRFIINEK